MAQEPEQPDLFDWQPRERRLFRDWQILKSKSIWIIAGLLIALFVVWYNFNAIRAFIVAENTNIFFSKYWLISFGTVAMILTFIAIWLIPKWQVRTLKNKKGGANQSEFDLEKERIKLRDDTRKTLAQIIGGAFFVLGLFVTYYTFDLNRQGQELNREAQVTDRFSKAVALLKEDDVSVRLGGLYALERVAKDSPKDHTTVMEILAAYIRERSKEQREQFIKDKEPANPTILPEAEGFYELPAPTDVLAAATIINRRTWENDKKDFVFDLSGANLRYADLRNAHLSDTNFIVVNLRQANLSFADVSDVIFNEADLSNADLSGADLRNAIFDPTSLYGTDFTSADLRGAKLGTSLGLTFEQIKEAIIDEETELPVDLEPRRAELLELSKKNLEARNKIKQP
ncbi:MAG TPA: pentapeptide repeat-containing protein [Pyrinomonadaceae bacterium]|jgi:membrane protein implicated in regulation of membrane protease activity